MRVRPCSGCWGWGCARLHAPEWEEASISLAQSLPEALQLLHLAHHFGLCGGK